MGFKKCDECGGDHYAKGKCRIHYRMPSQMSPKPLSKPKVKIKQFSDKKLTELAVYCKLRDQHFAKYPICQFHGCQSTNIELHHKKSRKYFLCDSESFMSVCRNHHNWIHENCKESYKLGYLIKSI